MALPGINLAISAVDLLLSTQAIDVVAILDGFTQVLADARPTRASIRQPSRLLDHTIESGQVITDYSVILPVEIDLSVIVQSVNYRSVAQEIIQLFQTKTILTVQLKEGNFINMVIADMPREETPQQFDAFSMVIRMRQVQVVIAAPPFNALDPTQANTQQLGQQTSILAIPAATDSFVTATPNTAGIQYSSVQNFSSPDYGIQGIPSSIPNSVPSSVPALGAQTLTNQTSLSSVFSGISGSL